MFKKFISFLIVTAMLFSSVPITVSATENSTSEESAVSVSNDDIAINGTNSFGNLLSAKLEDYTSEAEDSGSRISDIQITDTTATVTFDAIEDCTILVGIFDETTDQLLASGTTDVTTDQKTVDVSIETDTMPEYFVVKGYMLNSINSMIASEYNSPLYTREIQELKSKTVDDFEESEVLNLDDNDDTNFAVYKDGTVIIEYQEGYNVPERIDSENRTYVFSNATEEMMSLQSGDTLSYTYSEQEVLVVIVDSIVVEGTTVTITEKEAELEEIFEYVKIESESSSSDDFSVDNSELPDGVKPVNPLLLRSVSGNKNFSISQSYSLSLNYGSFDTNDKENSKDDNPGVSGSLKLTGSLTFSAGCNVNVYVSGFYIYMKVAFDYSTATSVSIDAGISATVPLGKFTFSPFLGVNLTFKPSLVLSASVSLEISITTYTTNGFSVSTDTGFQNESKNPYTESEFSIDGKVFVGISLELGVNIICEEVGKASLTFSGGIEITAAFASTGQDDSSKHICDACVGGEINLVFGVDGEISLFSILSFNCNIFEAKWKLSDWYFSFDFGAFGYSQCPYKMYKLHVKVTDDGTPLADEDIYISGKKAGSTDEDGIFETYLPNGKYFLSVNKCFKEFNIGNTKKVLKLDIAKDAIETGGTCGEDCYWQLYRGTLRIYGSGKMNNYGYGTNSKAPWSYVNQKIKSVIIYDGVTNIGTYAFYNCADIEKVKIPDSVTNIEQGAFSYCKSLNDVIIPDSVTSIGVSAFSYCSSLVSITIPETISKIENGTFTNCTGLKDISLTDSIKSIGDCAFKGCSSLESINIPYEVTEIGSYAFSNCTSLKKIVIPKGVTRISSDMFYGCSSLTDVTIPNSVTSIERGAFSNCLSLKNIVIPDSVTGIGSYAFHYCTSLKSIVIPDSVTSIGSYAFYYCTSLEKISIPNSIISIEDGTFFCCSNLSNIIIPDSVKNIGSLAFLGCPNLINISIPDSVTKIGKSAFENCTNLSQVVLSDSITNIGEYAFGDCTSLNEIIIPNGVETIEKGTFYNCTNLSKVVLPCELKSIGASAFSNCENLEKISIPDGVTSIEGFTFKNCTNLTSVIIPDDITSIGISAFEDCSSLTEINIPSGVTNIGSSAFEGCTSLTEINIPSGVTSIESCTFRSCSSLTSISIPEGVTSIAQYAFSDCTSLVSVTLPEGLKCIDNHAFGYCTKLTSINIPSSVTYIGSDVFRSCPCDSNIIYSINTASAAQTDSLLTSTVGNTSVSSVDTLAQEISDSSDASISAEINNLISNTTYFVVVVKSDSTDDLLSADNLLYFTQTTSDENGTVSLSYIPREACDNPIVLAYRAYVNNIEDAVVSINDMYYTGKGQTPEYTVSFNGKTLEENVDFTVSGDLSVTDAGYYRLTFTGINNYQGTVTADFMIIDAYLYGDADMDGKITIKDTSAIQKYLVQLQNLSETSVLIADVDGNGTVSIMDATIIQLYLVGNISSNSHTGEFSGITK